jgi:BlaI family penicillinase repressor
VHRPSAIQITDAEWEVMESVWTGNDQTAGEVLSRVVAGNRSHRTLRTLLARLVEKGAVAVRIERRRHLYSAAVTREACVRSVTRAFTNRFFAGNLHSLLLHFVEHESLSDEEVGDLRKRLELLENKPEKRPSKPSKKK